MSDLVSRLRALHAGQADPAELLDALVRHPAFQVPITHVDGERRDQLVKLGDGRVALVVFTSPEQAAAYFRSPEAPTLDGASVERSGTELVANLGDDIDLIEVDGAADHAITLDSEQFPALHAAARGAVAAELLGEGLTDPTHLGALAAYDGFLLVGRPDGAEGGMLLDTATRDDGPWLVVFSARTPLLRYLGATEKQGLTEPQILGGSGAEVFGQVERLGLVGAVVDLGGPWDPVLVPSAAAHRIARAGHGHG